MSDMIVFDCPHCGQALDVPVACAGQSAPCPACQKELIIPLQQSDSSEVDHRADQAPEELGAVGAQDDSSLSSSTVRIDLGDELELPRGKSRVFKIRRPESS